MSGFQANAIRLDRDRCVGCTNCIRRCPTGAIRVKGGKAQIRRGLCIDCGECIRICEQHAKIPIYDPMSTMDSYKYKVALPAPSLYGQFNNLEDSNIILTSLLKIGFDMVYEVASGAEIVSEMSRRYIAENKEKWPLISTACPTIVKLIRIRFPGLIDQMLPIQPPVEVAAMMAREKALKESGLPSEDIGIFFISPCSAKVTACRQPAGVKKTEVDHTLAIKDVYVKLLSVMDDVAVDPMDLAEAGRIGIGWGVSGGESAGLINDSYLAADGIENCIKVLNDIEDQKYAHLRFVELDACPGGCVGGVLTVENPYIAKAKLSALRKYLPVAGTHEIPHPIGMWTEEVTHQKVNELGLNFREKIRLMAQVEELTKSFPGIDCGSCGAPSCGALAEDIVRGEAKETDCVHVLLRRVLQATVEEKEKKEDGPEQS
ncbi:MAG: 4Fe-4S binding protein [Eubacterium sp.]|nr:4Fe-4S binding protein [Eubacterium sp.]